MGTIASIGAGQALEALKDARQAGLKPFANLNLTADQQTQIQSILQTAKQNGDFHGVAQQIGSVLTPAQSSFAKADIAAAIRQFGGDPNATTPSAPASAPTPRAWASDVHDARQAGITPYANLNLSSDQQSQVDAILKTALQSNSWSGVGAQLQSVLSPAQSTYAHLDTIALLAQFGGGQTSS